MTCRKGTVLRDGKCSDINECFRGTHTCRGNTKCENRYGGFKCIQCPAGMKPNDKRSECVDIDECKDNVCHQDASCTNTPGSYRCECNAGFSGDGNFCRDIDECATGIISFISGESITSVEILSRLPKKLIQSLDSKLSRIL